MALLHTHALYACKRTPLAHAHAVQRREHLRMLTGSSTPCGAFARDAYASMSLVVHLHLMHVHHLVMHVHMVRVHMVRVHMVWVHMVRVHMVHAHMVHVHMMHVHYYVVQVRG